MKKDQEEYLNEIANLEEGHLYDEMLDWLILSIEIDKDKEEVVPEDFFEEMSDYDMNLLYKFMIETEKKMYKR